MRRRVWKGVVFSLLVVLVLVPAALAGYPEKPLTVVCWSSAGSGHDLLARILAKVGEKHLGQPMAVLNKAGGQGMVAMSYVLGKPADGYTIMTNTRSMTERPMPAGSKVTLDSFAYICRVATDPFVVLVKKDSPLTSMKDLLALAKTKGKAVKIGGYSVKSVDQKLVLEIMKAGGIEMTYVPYKGGLEPVVAVLGGHLDVCVANPSEMMANYEAGQVKVLATCSEERFAPFTAVPTLKEQGLDIVEDHWRGLMAGKDVPRPIIDQLDAAFRKTIDDPEFVKFLDTAKMIKGYLPPDKFRDLVIKESQESAKK